MSIYDTFLLKKWKNGHFSTPHFYELGPKFGFLGLRWGFPSKTAVFKKMPKISQKSKKTPIEVLKNAKITVAKIAFSQDEFCL